MPQRLARTCLCLLLGLFAVPRVHAEGAPTDSLLDGYMRRMSDSTSAYFGKTADLPDTTGLDSALTVGLEQPAGGSHRTDSAA